MPDWIDPETLRVLSIAGIVVAVVLAVVVLRFVSGIASKMGLIGVLLVVGVLLWYQRAELADCVDTCACRVLGVGVTIPEDANRSCR